MKPGSKMMAKVIEKEMWREHFSYINNSCVENISIKNIS
jgi:hypothetical protein